MGNFVVLAGSRGGITVRDFDIDPPLPAELRLWSAPRLATDEYKRSPVVRKVFAVALPHSVPLGYLRVAQRLRLLDSI